MKSKSAELLVPFILLLAACGGDGGGPTGPTANTSGAFVFRETLADQADAISCSDRGTITIAQSGASFTGTVTQTGTCFGPAGSTDNSGSSTISGQVTGTTIEFGMPGCRYQGRVGGDPINAAVGTLSCTTQQGGHTFAFAGDWQFSSGVASVTISPRPAGVESGDTLRLTAELRDAAGNLMSGRRVTWTSSAPGVVAVDSTGRVRSVALGPAVITATSDPVFPFEDPQSDSETVRAYVVFTSVSAGDSHTCGVTTRHAAYCWGWQLDGRLGNNTPGSDYQTIPSPVFGGLAFSSVSAGVRHTCGVTTDQAAYCWGRVSEGELGSGSTTTFAPAPVQVSGAIAFSSISAGHDYTCAISTSGAAYCWGLNDRGQLGDDTYVNRATPVPVSSDLTFTAISAGRGDPGAHTCAITTTGTGSCWGQGLGGQLGRSDGPPNVPGPVAGGLSLGSVTTGGEHTCAVDATGAAYCWGSNFVGQLGDGVTYGTGTPTAVAGGLTFTSLTAGGSVTCGVTTASAGYCWGGGQLGTGVPPYVAQTTPAPVLGGLSFTSLSANGINAHICGLTTTGLIYCWGRGLEGQLGNGATTDQPTPVVVSGQR